MSRLPDTVDKCGSCEQKAIVCGCVCVATCFPVFVVFFFSSFWARLSPVRDTSQVLRHLFLSAVLCSYPDMQNTRVLSLHFRQDLVSCLRRSFSSAELGDRAHVWSVPLHSLKDDSVLIYLTLLRGVHFISLSLALFCCLGGWRASVVVWAHVSWLMVGM